MAAAGGRSSTWGWTWVALTLAFALHVVDEALNDFLAVYNPTAQAIRDRLPFLPLPTFTFTTWVTMLVAAVTSLFALAPLAFRGSRRLRLFAYPYAVVMFLNGLLHLVGSLYLGEPMPGVWTAPLLVVASAALLTSVSGTERQGTSPK